MYNRKDYTVGSRSWMNVYLFIHGIFNVLETHEKLLGNILYGTSEQAAGGTPQSVSQVRQPWPKRGVPEILTTGEGCLTGGILATSRVFSSSAIVFLLN